MEHGLPETNPPMLTTNKTAGEPTRVPRLHTVGMSQTVQVPVGGLETRVYPPRAAVDPRRRPVPRRSPVETHAVMRRTLAPDFATPADRQEEGSRAGPGDHHWYMRPQ